MARPSKYTLILTDRICAELAQGLSMRTVCRKEDMPACSTVFKWLREKPEFSEQYARAKEESADALIEEILDIADDGSNDWMAYHDKEGDCIGYKLNGEHVQRSRVRIDVRKWIASKLKPKKYGERTQQDITVTHAADEMTDAELFRIAASGSNRATSKTKRKAKSTIVH